ncbi:MAG: hypothetical protein K5754_14545 [Butyrivibrio sp.]|jgi:transcriptional regulator with XRE-family HTH domain|nr:hypothetical protein [Butyrivibrio sp.]
MQNPCTIFYSNFDYLLSAKEIRISDLEKALSDYCKASKIGYFSRLRPAQDSDGKLPSIDILLWLSDYFKVPLDTLIKTDLRFNDADYNSLVSLIDKLLKMTREGQIHWQKEQSFMDRYRQNLLYQLSSYVESLGKIEIIPVQELATGPVYFVIAIHPEGNKSEPFTITTKDSHYELLPCISTLYMIAVQETQSLKFSNDLRDTITRFLAQ